MPTRLPSAAVGAFLGLALGLLLGLVLGARFLGGDPAPSRAPAPAPLAGPAPETSASRVAPPRALQGRTVPVPAEASRPLALETPPEEVEALVETIAAASEETAPAEGERAITGRVLAPDGRGLAGALVRIERRTPLRYARDPRAVGAGPPAPERLEDVLREAAARYRERRAGRFETTSGPDGAFAFGSLPEGSYEISAWLEGWKIEADRDDRTVETGEEVVLRAVPVGELVVEIVREDGGPVEGAWLEVEGARGRTTSYRWSAEDPRLRLAVGEYRVRALAERLAVRSFSNDTPTRWRSDFAVVRIAGAERQPPLRLVLRERCGIVGRIITDGVLAGDDAFGVACLRLGPGEEPDLEELRRALERSDTFSSGEFAFLDLEPGRYALAARRGWVGPLEGVTTVELAGGIVRRDIVLDPFDPARYLIASVFGPDGGRVSNVHALLEHSWPQGRSRSGALAYPMADGRLALLLPEEFRRAYDAPGADSRFSLTIESEAWGEKRVELLPGQREVTVTLGEPATLLVTVVGPGAADPAALRRLRVCASRLEDGAGPSNPWGPARSAAVRPDATARLEPLAPGRYLVTLEPDSESGGFPIELASREVEVVPGEQTLTLTAPTLHELRVRAPREARHVLLLSRTERRRLGPTGMRAETDTEGVAVFRGVPPGSYRVQVPGLPGTLEVEVPCGEVVFEAQPPDALQLRLQRGAAGPLVEAGFRDGDLIVAIDGVELTAENLEVEMARWWLLEGSHRFEVLRDGERLTLTLDLGALREIGPAGWSLVPARR